MITCLPDVFNDEDKVYEKDSPHFVERIARTMRRDYEQIRSPHDLAAIIVESCTASASVTELGDAAPESETQFENFQYLDWFSLSIREVVRFISCPAKFIGLTTLDGCPNRAFRAIRCRLGEDGEGN